MAQRRAVAGLMAVCTVLAVVAADPVSAAPVCGWEPATSTVSVILPPRGGTLELGAGGEVILRTATGLTGCGVPVADVDTIDVAGVPAPDGSSLIGIDNGGAGGPFPPDLTFTMSLAAGWTTFILRGTPGADRYVVADGRLDMQGSSVEPPPVRDWYVDLSDGNDELVIGPIGVSMVAYGGRGDDVIEGTDRDDAIRGGDGGDVLRGGAGDDVLNGERGSDRSRGGPGDDHVWAAQTCHESCEGEWDSSPDVFRGGVGRDTIDYATHWLGAPSVAILNDGSPCSGRDADTDGDACDPGDEGDVVAEFEVLVATTNPDTLVGAPGVDETFMLRSGADVVVGNLGDDETIAIDSRDWSGRDARLNTFDPAAGTLTQGDDPAVTFGPIESFTRFVGSYERDRFIDDPNRGLVYDGGAGHDVFEQPNAGAGGDILIGGYGFDVVDYRGRTEDLVVTIGDERPDGAVGEMDLVAGSIEAIRGGDGDDALRGAAGPERLDGRGGGDTLRGGAGRDELIGGGGDDVARGGANRDRCRAEVERGCEE